MKVPVYMKRLTSRFLALFLPVCLLGCVKNIYDPTDKIPGEGNNPFAGVSIPTDFDWQTYHKVRLTIEPYDTYEGEYDYLIEVFAGDPDEESTELLATGTCNLSNPFNKLIVYPKGYSHRVYIRQTDPLGRTDVRLATLEPAEEQQSFAFDALPDDEGGEGMPEDQYPSRNPVYTYTQIVEDALPQYGDFDFNDVVVGLRLEPVSAGAYVEKLLLDIEIRALGANKRTGAYVHLPSVDPEDISRCILRNREVTSEQTSTPVYTITDDVHELFQYQGTLINTLDSMPYRPSIKRHMEITFKPGKVTDFTIDDLDFFTVTIHHEGEKLRNEIHRRQFTYTDKGVHYQYHSKENCVWALLIPGRFTYTYEHTFIAHAYPELLKWVTGDESYALWYKNYKEGKVYLKEE